MTKRAYTTGILVSLIAFVVYFIVAARPVPPETALVPRWLRSLESDYSFYFDGAAGPETGAQNAALPLPLEASPGEASPGEEAPLGTARHTRAAALPFHLGDRFGYVERDGVTFSAGRTGNAHIAAGAGFWAAWEDGADTIEIHNDQGAVEARIPGNAGWPLFMDGRFFLIGEELDYLSSLDPSGDTEWTYDFAAPLTDLDAAAGLVLAGFLDGAIEVLDRAGKRIFRFEPGGSRFSVIYSCRISRDGARIALVSGYDDQRFLLLEKTGDTWKVVYHEFLSGGFRRAVHLAFVDDGRRVAFEREGGIGIYDIARRKLHRLPLDGRLYALEEYGAGNLLFVITSQAGTRKKLVGISYPATAIMEAPFRSESAFLVREGERLYLGGGKVIAAFSLQRR